MIPSGAQGHETGRTDASSDVVLLHPESDDVTVEEDWANGDITRLRAAHAMHRVKARVQFRDLRKKNVDTLNHVARIRTDAAVFTVHVFAGTGSWDGQSFLARNRVVKCRGLEHDIDYAENTARISVPRSCLGRPKWVRIGAATSSFVDAAEESRFDDALSTGNADEVPDRPAMGRRLRRC